MPARRRSRQRALQALYQWDIRKFPIEDLIANYYETLSTEEHPDMKVDRDPFMEQLSKATVTAAAEIDRHIERHAANWRIERMPVVDRNVLRLAVCELLTEPTPPAVVIDEALELARRYSGEEAVRFVNGVLDAIYHSLKRANQAAFHVSQSQQAAIAG
jgi:N utilization substance protein B